MMLTLNSTLKLNRLERVVRKHSDYSGCSPGNVLHARGINTCYEIYGNANDCWLPFLHRVSDKLREEISSPKNTFLQLQRPIALDPIIGKSAFMFIMKLWCFKTYKVFHTSRHCSHREYVIIPFTPYSLTNDEKKLFLQSVVGRIKPIPLTPKWSNPILRRQ